MVNKTNVYFTIKLDCRHECSNVYTNIGGGMFMITTITSREFNHDRGGAKKAAQSGPVFITDRGKPSLVLMTAEEYRKLVGKKKNLVELLAMPGVEDIDFEPPKLRDFMRPADFS
jgi:prevent-host-death family protein